MCKDKVKLTMNVPRDKKERAQAIAGAKGLTLTSLVIIALNDIIEEDDKKAASKG